MKKKTKIILACIAACIIVAAVAVVIKVNLDSRQRTRALRRERQQLKHICNPLMRKMKKEKKQRFIHPFNQMRRLLP